MADYSVKCLLTELFLIFYSIIRLILQFLDEQGLGDTRQALESETSIKLNTVTNKQDFTQDIIQGKWDTVLQKVVTLNVRPKALIDLYEQVYPNPTKKNNSLMLLVAGVLGGAGISRVT